MLNQYPSTSFPGRGKSCAPGKRSTIGAEWRRLVVLSLCVVVCAGCASTRYVKVREAPHSPLVDQLKLTARGGPEPSERTMQLLRRYNLDSMVKSDLRPLLDRLQKIIDLEPTADNMYAFAELSYLGGKKFQKSQPETALDLYGSSVTHAFAYLFDERFGGFRNPYDPHFRSACDLYNGALEDSLRIAQERGQFLPGNSYSIRLGSHACDVDVVIRCDRWRPEDIERFEFVSDYEVLGLTNKHRTYGLGVPLIAVRRSPEERVGIERYYPPELSVPMTAFLRVLPTQGEHGACLHAVLELYDPLVSTDIEIAGRRVPLESDLSTPLAYFLDNPELTAAATDGLFNPDKVERTRGINMLEPYDPDKIPVLMVHGLWSSPLTWMEMFNDLRSMRDLNQNYQFWFYLYPSGQPFWTTAKELRQDLAELRSTIDPHRQSPALDQMVLVGHSMGGLVSKMQTIDSGDNYWQIVSDKPFHLVKASNEVRQNLEQLFFFRPNPSIRRVVTIGTPHRGSKFANDYTRYIAQKLITLPKIVMVSRDELFRENRDLFRDDQSFYNVKTSIDSLSPDSPVLPVMLAADRPPWVKYHNIIGVLSDEGIVGTFAGGTDGVVSYESAHLDNVESEVIVNADHMTVHRHPLAILEVRRILVEHLIELQSPAGISREEQTAMLDRAMRSPNGLQDAQLPAAQPEPQAPVPSAPQTQNNWRRLPPIMARPTKAADGSNLMYSTPIVEGRPTAPMPVTQTNFEAPVAAEPSAPATDATAPEPQIYPPPTPIDIPQVEAAQQPPILMAR